jgi:hypothetical protein
LARQTVAERDAHRFTQDLLSKERVRIGDYIKFWRIFKDLKLITCCAPKLCKKRYLAMTEIYSNWAISLAGVRNAGYCKHWVWVRNLQYLNGAINVLAGLKPAIFN